MAMSPAVTATFERLLAVGRREFLATTIDEMLCSSAGLARQRDWPLASLAALADGLSLSTEYVLFAQPVHLQLQRDTFSIAGPEGLPLQKTEADALLALLNQHFAEQGLMFVQSPYCAHRWYLQVQTQPNIQTTPVDVAMGRDIRNLMPQGRDAAFWNAFLNEVQMLLFEHPLNQAREARGELPVSGVWVYGGGVLPSEATGVLPLLFTEDPVVRGLAVLHVGECHEVPQEMHEVLRYEAKHAWLAPVESAAAVVNGLPTLWQALRRGGVSQLELNIAIGDRVLQCRVGKWDTYQFWRKSRPWTEVLGG
ncbi:hypothetical protein LG204_04440 [Methylovorus menthalis]|uniref:hypothetical protein n=1 Tax=Methylovorus menthalis TaxID=1002227 RepID=UPI001E289842|nr:hypothetical protein [Methylovorus menthalis]MCB4810564.1 hypothetical protein [Methylovorus menthalis]